MTTARPFLMFQGGVAQSALDLYFETFQDSGLTRAEYYGPGDPGSTGAIKVATSTICSREFMCSDSPVPHPFSFTPSSSTFIEFDSVEDMERAFLALSEGGQVMMPPDNYGFSKRLGWLADRFGVSWQLNVAA